MTTIKTGVFTTTLSDEDLDNFFTYHAPTAEQKDSYEVIRYAAKILATTIRDNCPVNADTSMAIRKVREAVMTANAAIACEKPNENRS